ncbi:hypothetical protein ACVCNR_14680 [Aquamicrobium terrae]
MNPTLVHRYAFPVHEAIETLLGDAVGDCEAWRIRIEGDEVVIDVVAPAPGIVPTTDDVTSLASDEAGKINMQDPAPELKGGALARRAAITCAERGFRTFLGVSSAEEAKIDVCRRCGITTRKMLDHDERAAAIWDDIIGKYRLWLEGHDVGLDDLGVV